MSVLIEAINLQNFEGIKSCLQTKSYGDYEIDEATTALIVSEMYDSSSFKELFNILLDEGFRLPSKEIYEILFDDEDYDTISFLCEKRLRLEDENLLYFLEKSLSSPQGEFMSQMILHLKQDVEYTRILQDNIDMIEYTFLENGSCLPEKMEDIFDYLSI